MKKQSMFLAVILSLLLVFPPNAIAAVVGTVTYIEGRVDKLSYGGDTYVPVVVGEEISTGDVIRTKSYSKAELTFNDNSVVRLGDTSQVRVKEYAINEEGYREAGVIYLDRGKMRAIVSKTIDKAPFDIKTSNASGSVKGSDIFVSFQQSATSVMVAEGVFSMINPAFPGQGVDVSEGMASFVPHDAPPADPRVLLPAERDRYEAITGPTVYKVEGAVKGAEFTKAVVARVAGAVRVQPKGSGKWHVPVRNEVLNAGDRIETGKSGRIRISFDNGLIMELKPNTQLIITELTCDPRSGARRSIFESSYGKIIAKFQKMPYKSSFMVKTPHATIGVRGTIMYLEILPDFTRAFFEGGNGYVTDPATGVTTVIQEGMTSSVDADGNVSETPTTDEDRAGFNSTFGDESGDEYGYAGGDSAGDTSDADSTPASTPAPAPAPADSGVPGEEEEVFDEVTPEVDTDGGTGGSNITVSADFEGKMGYYGSFAVDDASSVTGTLLTNVDAAPWTGTFQGTVTGILDNPDETDYHLVFGDVTGTGSDGGSIRGWMVGTDRGENEWEGVFAALYVDSSNTAGALFGDLTGTHELGNPSLFQGNGDVIFTPLPADIRSVISGSIFQGTGDFEFTPAPDSVSPDVLENLTENTDDPLDFRFSSDDGAAYVSGSHVIKSLSLTLGDETWGLWEAIYGAGDGQLGEVAEWSGSYGRDFDDGSYILGQCDAADDLNGFLHVDTVYIYMTPLFLEAGFGTIIGSYGDEVSSYSPYYFEGAGTGIWALDPFAWSAEIDANYHYYDSVQDVITPADSHYGIAGATASPFDPPGEAVDITLMGKAYPADYITWWGSLKGSYANDGSVIPEGFIAGRTNSIEGMLAALYIDNSGNAGTLSGNFEGDYYDEIDMWIATGNMTATQRAAGYSPDDYLWEASAIDGGILGGSFNGSGDINSAGLSLSDIASGEPGSCGAYLVNQTTGDPEPWGVFNIELGGYYDNPDNSDDWTLYLGGAMRDPDDTEEYWVAEVAGSQWSEQRIAGTIIGKYISPKELGTVAGDVLGSYDTAAPGIWEAIALGTYEGEPLAFVSSLDEGFFQSYYFDAAGYPVYSDVGDINGLMGGTGPLWAGGGTDVTLIGDYDTGGDSPCFWHVPVYSINIDALTEADYYTTYDGGAFYGYLVGVGREEDNEIEGLMTGFYMDPDGNAGYVYGTVSGPGYPELGDDSGIFALEGVLETTPMPYAGALTPADLYGYVSDPDNWGTITGFGYTSENSFMFSAMIGEGIEFENYSDWGIWKSRILGSFEGSALPSSSWRVPQIGRIIETDSIDPVDYYPDPGDAYSAITGTYFMGLSRGTDWQPGGRVAGEFEGIWISRREDGSIGCGTISGDIAGSNEYVDAGEEFVGSWEAVGAGQWVEAEELFDLESLTSTIEELDQFDMVSIPVTETGITGVGWGGIESAAMDITLYEVDLSGQGIWAAIINGTYDTNSPPAGTEWGATFEDAARDMSVTLSGLEWADGNWLAEVNGEIGENLVNGTASGTYADGDFSGVGAGEWINKAVNDAIDSVIAENAP